MSLANFKTPLVIELGRSKFIISFLVIAHSLAALSVLLLNAPLLLKSFVILLLLLSAAYYIYRYEGAAASYKPAKIILSHDKCQIETKACELQAVTLTGAQLITPYLTILSCVDESKNSRNILIAYDMLPNNIYRLLRVRLKLHDTLGGL